MDSLTRQLICRSDDCGEGRECNEQHGRYFGKHGYKETVLTSSLSNARVQDKRRLYLCGGETVARDVDHVCWKNMT